VVLALAVQALNRVVGRARGRAGAS
jgi:hypothetical protein